MTTTDTTLDDTDAPTGLASLACLAPDDISVSVARAEVDVDVEVTAGIEDLATASETSAYVRPVKDLASLAPKSIPAISQSNVFAVVAMQVSLKRPVEHRRVEIPARFQTCPIYRALLYYFNSKKCLVAKPVDTYRKAMKLNALGDWALEKYPNANHLPKAVIQDFSRHLRDEKLQQSSVCVYMSGYRIALDSFLEHAHGNADLADQAAIVREVIATIPSIPNRAARPTDSLAQITNQLETDEEKLLRSTIHFCCQFLKKMNDQRQELLQDEGVKKALQRMLDTCGSDHTQLKYTTSDTKRSTTYGPLAVAILNSDSLQLKERLLHNQVEFSYASIEQSAPLTLEQANEKIKKGLRHTGTLEIYPEDNDDKLYFHNIDYLFLIKHTPSEEAAFSWLLATDRIQGSGIDRMRQGDLRITPTTASPIFIKERSEQRMREVPMHFKKTLQYQAYVDFNDLKVSFHKRFPENGDQLVETPGSANYQVVDGTIYRPLIMASYSHTAQYKAQLEGGSDLDAFADIVRRVAANNRVLWKPKKTGKSPVKRVAVKELHVGTTKRQTITVTAIAQSRAIVDDSGYSTKNEAYEKYSQEVVSADATAHSPHVKEVIYKHASETKYRLGKRAEFATSVGALMVEDARKVQAAMRGEVIVSVEELKVMLGWADAKSDMTEMEEFDQLLLSALEAGFNVSPFGELEKDGETYIINSAVSAALLIDYKKECFKQIERLTVEDELKAFAIAMQAAHIEHALERFDRKAFSEGEAILKVRTFPTPVIR